MLRRNDEAAATTTMLSTADMKWNLTMKRKGICTARRIGTPSSVSEGEWRASWFLLSNCSCGSGVRRVSLRYFEQRQPRYSYDRAEMFRCRLDALAFCVWRALVFCVLCFVRRRSSHVCLAWLSPLSCKKTIATIS